MGRNNRARRAAKARMKQRSRARARGGGGAQGGSSGAGGTREHDFRSAYRNDPEGWTKDLLAEAGKYRYSDREGRGINPDLRAATLTQLGRLSLDEVATAAERVLLEHLDATWQGGWQPVEVRRQARLNGQRVVTARLMDQLIANDDARRRAATLDTRWIEQVESMDLPRADGEPGWVHRWLRQQGLDVESAVDVIADALAVLWLPQLEQLIPPPGSVGSVSAKRKMAVRNAASSERDPLLERIRALLAKAESTDFEEEAMAFTAKAQELITRHAIDEAMVDGDAAPSDEEPSIVRIPVDPPYGDAKGLMLQIVAQHTRCRALIMTGLHMSRVVGFPADLAAVEMLFTSLLIQAQTALAQASTSAPPGTRTRSSAYRASFLVAYAGRIGDRLAEINAAVEAEVAESQGGAFLPVLRARDASVDDFMNEHYGNTVTKGVRGGYDPAAAAHGRMAADAAKLSFGDVEGAGAASPATTALPPSLTLRDRS